jgi:hypothetical protein
LLTSAGSGGIRHIQEEACRPVVLAAMARFLDHFEDARRSHQDDLARRGENRRNGTLLSVHLGQTGMFRIFV